MGSGAIKFFDDVLGMDFAEDARTEQRRAEKQEAENKRLQQLYEKRGKIARNNEKVKKGQKNIESTNSKSNFNNANTGFNNQNKGFDNKVDKQKFNNQNTKLQG